MTATYTRWNAELSLNLTQQDWQKMLLEAYNIVEATKLKYF